MKIGIFGGTFDPFTIAHLAIAEKVLEDKLVDKVVIAPTIVTWHRSGKTPFLSNVERSIVINHFIAKSKYGMMMQNDGTDLFHIAQTYPSIVGNRRFIHTLADISFRYGPENDYYTIIGTDSLDSFHTWYKHEAILAMSKLIAVDGRNGNKLEDNRYGEIVVQIDPKFAKVSATDIRSRFSAMDEYLKYVDSLPV